MAAGKLVVFRRLNAREQLELLREYPRLVPRLARWGLGPDDALAVAWNAALLYRVLAAQPALKSPGEVLERYSLGEMAELCETYEQVAAGELEYGEGEAE